MTHLNFIASFFNRGDCAEPGFASRALQQGGLSVPDEETRGHAESYRDVQGESQTESTAQRSVGSALAKITMRHIDNCFQEEVSEHVLLTGQKHQLTLSSDGGGCITFSIRIIGDSYRIRSCGEGITLNGPPEVPDQ